MQIAEDIQTALKKLTKTFEEEKPSVKNTFKSLSKLRELIQKYFLESDLEIDECMELFKAFRESETASVSKSYFTSGYMYEEIINKILANYTYFFDSKDLKMLAEFSDKYGMEYNIYNVLPQLTDKINKEQLHAFLDIVKKLQGGDQDSED
jgi:hypothetical protein